MSKFTKGPWRVSKTREDLPGEDVTSVRAANGALIAEVYAQRDDNPEWSYGPNAALIAAAPDGHDILILLKRFIDEGATQISFGALMDTDDETTLGQALKAYFAKATGGAE